MEFKYVASTAEGGLINGMVEADSETSAEEILWRSGLTIVDLKKSLKLPPLHKMLPSLFGVKRRDVIVFSRNMASLLVHWHTIDQNFCTMPGELSLFSPGGPEGSHFRKLLLVTL